MNGNSNMEFATVFILISTNVYCDAEGRQQTSTFVVDTFSTYAECKLELMEDSTSTFYKGVRWYDDLASNLTFAYGETQENLCSVFTRTCLKTKKR